MGRITRINCPMCAATFTRNGDMLIHKFVAHDGGRFKCPNCQRELKSKAGLKIHMRTHTNTDELQQPTGQQAMARRTRSSTRRTGSHQTAGPIPQRNVQPPSVEEAAPTARGTRSNTRRPSSNPTAAPISQRTRKKTKSAAPKAKNTTPITSKSKKPAAPKMSTRKRK